MKQLTAFILISLSLSCSREEPGMRLYADIYPSPYLDSLFSAHKDILITVRLNQLRSDSLLGYEQQVSPTKKVRINLSDSDPIKPPIYSCQFSSDSSIAVAAVNSEVRF